MIELRFNALKPNGQVISGTINAASGAEGKAKINALVQKHGLTLKSVEKKSTFIFKIKKGNEKPTTGEQRAFIKKK
jgi:hypothetical protein